MEEVKKWLNKVGLENYIEHFVEHAIDEVVIDELNEDDLREIGLTLGARKRFLKALPFNRIDPSLAEESTSEAERRQVTVVFCDLVDSTPLAERLDPEELRSLIESFQEICVRVVTKHKGYIARYLGDGILIYFGYPRAQEGDAVRAVYAALEIVETISRRTDLDLQVHIGIHTGLVVAGDTREEKAAIFGDTPNIAARIEGIAGPDEVFLSPTTKNLVDSYIVTDIMGSYELKGLSKPMVLYKATELKTAHANSERNSNNKLPALVGREHEIRELLQKWECTLKGDAQVVVITAEPGVGKTCLLSSFGAQLHSDHTCINYFCSAFHQNSAFFPITSQLESALELKLNSDEENCRLRIGDFINNLALEPEVGLMLEQMLGLTQVPKSNSQQFTDSVSKGIVDILCAMAKQRPLLLAVEDAHWVDPSTSKVLHELVDRVGHARIMIVITLRTEAQEQWAGLKSATVLALSALSGEDSIKLVKNMIESSGISRSVALRIAEQADGVPLFLEELTKSTIDTLDSEAIVNQPFAVPISLRDALMARLDGMGEMREIAQIASIFGRRFDAHSVASVAGRNSDDVESSLQGLVESDVLLRRNSELGEQVFEFRHALIRDLAYESLLQSKRRRFHGRIAVLLASENLARVEPELLAWHYEYAGEIENAITQYSQAAQAANRLFAHSEAVQHLKHAIYLLLTEPRSTERDDTELQLRLSLGPSLMTKGGYASEDVIENYSLARQIYEDYQDRSQLFLVLHGLYQFQMVGGNLPGGQMLAEEMLTIGKDSEDPLQILVGHASLGTISILQGKISASLELTTEGIAQIDLVQDDTVFAGFGHDHRVSLRLYNAWALAILGQLPEARATVLEAVRIAEAIQQPSSLGFALCYTGQVLNVAGFYIEARHYIDRARELCKVHQMPLWNALSQIQLGWSELLLGDAAAGFEISIEGINSWFATGARSGTTFFHTCVADGLLIHGDAVEACKQLDAAQSLTEDTGELFQLPEILRLRAMLEPEPEIRINLLNDAMKVAEQEEAILIKLKIATELHLTKATSEHESKLRALLNKFVGAAESKHVQRAMEILGE